ncbi:phage virion morphogenesis protein [Aeromonas salmonicida subsp. achromogenes]|uniref:phage virion morphogenesis protein n=1 Tax=Aeromonas salmonicida TaxID=645 RepID=UPI0002F346E5|nr:phage virion morphogenesis protein [Aeromonas salmonicida]TMX14230.1 phage virion morphogenesis protein [Aeromonas salmonicida subsp. achromogenes]TMX15636.1 phage virion morphogenesis protein [Aeromonas salmonicida subsp. achromogenes]TMX18652.1 phage virion morphogenesis protein [Aeromonas salmonicida subsp. achromogenes]TMX21295.1 phage virion morphogenesis protein [Aeromonas salmonicida subsp. achromogenes]
MISLTLNQSTMRHLLERLDAASLPPAKRRRITQQIGREVAKVSRQRIRAGKAPDGTKWAPTKSKRKHKRLTGLSKRLRSRGTEDAAIIDFDSRFAGMIANQNHQGMSQPFTAAPPKPAQPRKSERGKKQEPFKPTDSPCTRSQAQRLRALGYKVLSDRGARRRYRKPSLKWIREHVSVTRAAILIRTTTGETRKHRWTVETPARPMLPQANNDELLAIAAKAFQKMGWGAGQ